MTTRDFGKTIDSIRKNLKEDYKLSIFFENEIQYLGFVLFCKSIASKIEEASYIMDKGLTFYDLQEILFYFHEERDFLIYRALKRIYDICLFEDDSPHKIIIPSVFCPYPLDIMEDYVWDYLRQNSADALSADEEHFVKEVLDIKDGELYQICGVRSAAEVANTVANKNTKYCFTALAHENLGTVIFYLLAYGYKNLDTWNPPYYLKSEGLDKVLFSSSVGIYKELDSIGSIEFVYSSILSSLNPKGKAVLIVPLNAPFPTKYKDSIDSIINYYPRDKKIIVVNFARDKNALTKNVDIAYQERFTEEIISYIKGEEKIER